MFVSVWFSDAILPACSGSFRHSLVLTSTVEPRGTFTTDLASHFQCSNGRPLVSVSTVPSSFQITSLRLLLLSLSSLICPNLPLPLAKRKPQTGQISSIALLSFAACFCPEREIYAKEKKGKKKTPHASLKSNCSL